MMKRAIFFVIFVSTVLSLPALAKRFTYGFKCAKMRLDYPFLEKWEVPFKEEVLPILKQPYHFLGKGAQMYVFESQDQKYVVKLFRYDQPNKIDKVEHLFEACKIAYEQLLDETGLIYIHLNPSQLDLPLFHCKDAIGRSYTFALDQTRFAIQKKATVLVDALNEAKKEPEMLRKRITQLVNLLVARAKKKITNTDPNLSRNFGFLEDSAVEFDFGNFQKADDFDAKKEVTRYTDKLRAWLEKNAPEELSYLDEKIQECL